MRFRAHARAVQALFLTNLTAVAATLVALSATVAALHALERAQSRFVAHHWGWRGVLITGWLGVPLHELSHLVSAFLFGHRVIGWSLFDPDPASGTLGYVRHAHSKRTAWQILGNFWIGIAPILAGGAALLVLLFWMVPHDALLLAAADCASMIREGRPRPESVVSGVARAVVTLACGAWRGRSVWLPLQLYVAIAIACHMSPSPRDLGAALSGFVLLILVLAVACATAALAGLQLTSLLMAIPVAALLVALVASFQLLWGIVVLATARA